MKANLARSLFWAIALTAAISASAAFSRASSSLISNASPVPGTKGRAGFHFWVGNHDVLTLPNLSTASTRPVRINSQTREATPLPAISAALAQNPVRGSWRVSPDGERLLWAQQIGPTYRWIVHHLSTGKSFPHASHAYDPVRRPAAAWNPDGISWVELRPLNGEYYALTNDPSATEIPRARRVKGITDPAQIVSVSSDGRITAIIRQPMAYWEGDLARINVDSGMSIKTKAPIPPQMGAMGASISPDESRMALMLWNRDPSSGYRLLGPLLSELGIRDQRFGTLRILDTTGRNLGDLGSIQWTADRRRWRSGSAWQLKWTPDGKRLSFVHNDQLYTIPAP